MDGLSRFSMMGLIPSGPHALCSSSSLISLSMPAVLISMGGMQGYFDECWEWCWGVSGDEKTE